MGYAKKVAGEEFKFRLALELGKTVEDLENGMTHSEFVGWMEYFSTRPSIQEIQMAQLTMIQAAKGGMKNVAMSDFMVTKIRNVSPAKNSIRDATVAEINELLGV